VQQAKPRKAAGRKKVAALLAPAAPAISVAKAAVKPESKSVAKPATKPATKVAAKPVAKSASKVVKARPSLRQVPRLRRHARPAGARLSADCSPIKSRKALPDNGKAFVLVVY
jgi:ribonuclease R